MSIISTSKLRRDFRRQILPLTAMATAAAVLAGTYAYAAGWFTPARLTPVLVVGTFERNFGTHPGLRRNHAKGMCVTGWFDGNGTAQIVSKASVFGVVRTPVIGRFAIPGGNPAVPDASSPVRSLALSFQLRDGEQWHTGMNSTPVFIVNTPQGFYDNLLASRPDPATHKPDPSRLKAFFDAHPESGPFRAWIKDHPLSSSFTNTRYWGINAFKLVDRDGHARYARWSFVPEQAWSPLSSALTTNPDVLFADLSQRLHAGPVRWHLELTVAEPGDPTDDATRAWPADRPKLDAGVLTLSQAIDQGDGPCRDVNFDPTVLPRGIETSNDPLLAARSGAYSRSFNLRNAERAQVTAAKHGDHL